MLPHRHKYMLVNTKKEFEPVDPEEVQGISDLYRMVDYAIMVCYCTDVIKKVIRYSDEKDLL